MSKHDVEQPQRQRFALVVEAMPDDVPDIIRLRRALKCLLRSFHFRCVRARHTTGEDVDLIDSAEAPGSNS